VVRITTTNICGSDLHMYEGRTNVEAGKVLGHENMGIVEETGPGVTWKFDQRVDGFTKVLLHPANT
jgi:threonine dehydrogenase-like Zn-dependent dehydrogenase